MGLFKSLFRKRIKDPIEGTAQVVSCSGTSDHATYQTCRLQLVINAEGIEPFAIDHTQILKTSRWPHPGMQIPVVLSRSDPSNLQLDFDSVPDWQDAGMDRAEQIAAAMRDRGDAPTQITQLPGGGSIQVVNLSGDPVAAEDAIAKAEQATGMDLNADGKIGGGVATPPSSGAEGGAASGGADGDDRLEQLERLAKLRDSGALSDAEFEAEKARILGSG